MICIHGLCGERLHISAGCIIYSQIKGSAKKREYLALHRRHYCWASGLTVEGSFKKHYFQQNISFLKELKKEICKKRFSKNRENRKRQRKKRKQENKREKIKEFLFSLQ